MSDVDPTNPFADLVRTSSHAELMAPVFASLVERPELYETVLVNKRTDATGDIDDTRQMALREPRMAAYLLLDEAGQLMFDAYSYRGELHAGRAADTAYMIAHCLKLRSSVSIVEGAIERRVMASGGRLVTMCMVPKANERIPSEVMLVVNRAFHDVAEHDIKGYSSGYPEESSAMEPQRRGIALAAAHFCGAIIEAKDARSRLN